MARSGFFERIRDSIEVEGEGKMDSVSTHRSAHTLLPLTRLDTEKGENAEIQRLIRQVDKRLGEMLGSGGERWRRQKSSIRSTIRELCMNIFHHADADEGWIAAQRYFNHYTGEPYIEIAIGDAGQGIRRSLVSSYPELHSAGDSVVMRRMVTERLTSSKDQRRGNGYYVLQRATRLLDGSFLLWSGDGAVQQNRGSQKLQASNHATSWPGTQLKVRLTCR